MSRGLPAYPDYRDSGLPWLGEIPAHWEVRRNGRLFAERRELADPDLPLLEVSLRTGVRVRALGEGARKQVMADRSKYQRARAGDLAYNTMRMWQGAVGVAPTDGLISPAYVVARPYPDVEPRYYAYLFRTAAYLQQVEIESRGIVPDRNRLYWDAFKQMPSVYPPIEEQRAIADYLDAHGRLVQRYERAKRRTIAILDERQRDVVRSLLSGGEDYRGLQQNSGSRSLGTVPSHWKLMRLKHAARRIVGGATPESANDQYWNGRIVWVTPEDVSQSSHLVDSRRRLTETGLQRCAARLVPAGAVVVTSRAPVGNVAVAGTELCTNQGCKAIVPNPDMLDSTYLYWLMVAVRPDLEAAANGSTFTEVSTWTVANLRVALPPLAEQRCIVGAIHNATSRFARAVTQTHAEIALVQEHRNRLIAAAVAGAVRVSGDLLSELASEAVRQDGASDQPLSVDDEVSEFEEVTSDAD